MVVLGQCGCIWAKVVAIVVVFGQDWQSGCIRGKVVVFVKSGSIREKVVVFGQSCCIDVFQKWLNSGKTGCIQKWQYGCIWAKLLSGKYVFGKSGCIRSGCIRTKVVELGQKWMCSRKEVVVGQK